MEDMQIARGHGSRTEEEEVWHTSHGPTVGERMDGRKPWQDRGKTEATRQSTSATRTPITAE